MKRMELAVRQFVSGSSFKLVVGKKQMIVRGSMRTIIRKVEGKVERVAVCDHGDACKEDFVRQELEWLNEKEY